VCVCVGVCMNARVCLCSWVCLWERTCVCLCVLAWHHRQGGPRGDRHSLSMPGKAIKQERNQLQGGAKDNHTHAQGVMHVAHPSFIKCHVSQYVLTVTTCEPYSPKASTFKISEVSCHQTLHHHFIQIHFRNKNWTDRQIDR
jgi:hypothetical protein